VNLTAQEAQVKEVSHPSGSSGNRMHRWFEKRVRLALNKRQVAAMRSRHEAGCRSGLKYKVLSGNHAPERPLLARYLKSCPAV